MTRALIRREAEWRLQDVALLQAALDRENEKEPTSYGVPVSIAYDGDSDPNNRDSPYVLEPYSYTDYAAQVVRIAQDRLTGEFGEHALDDRVFGVRQVPRTPLSPLGG